MYVCLCNAVTDSEIRQAVCEGACSLRELRDKLGVASNCGRCAPFARELLEQTLIQSIEAGLAPA